MTARLSKLIEKLRALDKVRVLFVCLGNICRSPAAEGVFRSIVEANGDGPIFEIDSAGMGDWHIGQLPDKRMRNHASRRGYELTHHARQVKSHDFDDFDIIIAMDSNNERDLRRLARTADDSEKIVQMSAFFTPGTTVDYVPDPYYEGPEGFELVLDLLESSCEILHSTLKG